MMDPHGICVHELFSLLISWFCSGFAGLMRRGFFCIDRLICNGHRDNSQWAIGESIASSQWQDTVEKTRDNGTER